jgi:hypothetical protein
MDGRRFIKAMFASDKAHSITQVVMNLPNDAAEFLGRLSWWDHFLFLYNTVLYSNPTHLFSMI